MTLKQWMKREKLSQKDAAARLGVNASDISRWSNGKSEPSLSTALQVETRTRNAVRCEDLALREPEQEREDW